jgi:hypothetical protein
MIKSRRIKWAGPVVHMVEMRNAYKTFIGKPEGKRLHGRPRHRWEDNIKMDLREVEWEGLDWIHLSQDRDQWWDLVKTAMNILDSIKGRGFLD